MAKRAHRPAAQSVADPLIAAVRAGDRRSLARTITLIESQRRDHRRRAEALIEKLLPASGKSIRLGVSGAPGVGKSTFIEAFGLHVISTNHRVAVLAVDPSSQRSGGSILGDKTRMEELARLQAAFIRPSPAGATLGGVARRTHEAAIACEAAGFDVVLIETVGVGQSETAVAEMVDVFLLLIQPGAGDELQGFKRGIIELADLLIVTKSDGELAEAAGRAVADYRNAVRLLRPPSPHWTPQVLACSAFTGAGIPEIWQTVENYQATLGKVGEIDSRRAAHARAWMWREVSESLMEALHMHAGIRSMMKRVERKVSAGKITPTAAAEALLKAFRDPG